ncbi:MULTISPECIES: calcium-binding protein [Inquilinus]|uniref:Ca2+-binding RTX toxin-like protein n=1 Tax=Inquilinus ginsengisoli TaxID=363840 RepID=A0ABU1JVI3_9PROT|nr:calcium-binding protein [Inquilinus ginsengisoli]MDR6292623.1 Ca2+-binding RTX toxin-like protein [Inquilinus ginsengisoli]
MTTFTGTNGDDMLPTGSDPNGGDDIFFGLDGNDDLNMGIGNDQGFGGNGNDHIDGGGGDDYLDGGAGDDNMVGNFGDDTYIVDSIGDTVTEFSATDGIDTIYSSVTYTMPHFVDRLILTGSAAINATGTADADTLVGNTGDNILTGLAGTDFLSGGDGNDRLFGGLGPDVLDGGNGSDAVYYIDSTVGVTVSLVSGAGIGGTAQGDSLINIESLSGSSFADTLTGNSGANILRGNGGNDVLQGNGGQDVIGGDAGADRFVYAAITDSAVGVNADRILDFSSSQGDKIDLHLIDANTTVAGDQAFTFIAGAFTHVAGQLHAIGSGADTLVEGDVNGDGTADFQIKLSGLPTLVAGDFIL